MHYTLTLARRQPSRAAAVGVCRGPLQIGVIKKDGRGYKDMCVCVGGGRMVQKEHRNTGVDTLTCIHKSAQEHWVSASVRTWDGLTSNFGSAVHLRSNIATPRYKSCTLPHTHTYTHIHTRIHTYTYTRTHTHTRTHAYIHTHTHTHIHA